MLRKAALAIALVTTSAATSPPQRESGQVVVMVNDKTGSVERLVNHPRSYLDAWVRYHEAKGFRILVASGSIGFGATFCVTRDLRGTSDSLGRTLKEHRFFYTVGHRTVQEAISMAREQTRSVATQWHEYPYICGTPWEVIPQIQPDRVNLRYTPPK